ncbi:MAG TPA: universal stress protein [Bryobacteraceae bacterium]|nr:universal stress protein [Bryobacteraceae bacterium]
MYRHILAPVDFSPIAAIGLRHAARLAQCGPARLTALFADPFTPPLYFTESRVQALAGEFREAMRDAEERLRAFVREHAPGTPADAVVMEKLPVDGILAAIPMLGIDLVAMGTHGRSGFNRLMLGSVAEKVLRASPVPVLTVGQRHPEPEIRRILVPANDSDAARQALAEAAEIAVCTGASLTLLYVRDEQAGEAAPDLCAWVPPGARGRCEIRQITVEGDPAERIVENAAALEADLVVLGTRRRPFADATVLGSTTARVVRHAPCAVLTVIHRTAAVAA